MKPQIVLIHGGNAFNPNQDLLEKIRTKPVTIDKFKNVKSWREHIEDSFKDQFEIFMPKMPNKESAKYEEWKAWFERLVPFLNDDVALIGHSLGAMFLIKYLSENTFPKKIKLLALVAPPYFGKDNKHEKSDFFFASSPESFESIAHQAGNIYLFHSKDDEIVPFSDFEIYKQNLPSAQAMAFTDRGHFNLPEFPELVEIIKAVYKV